jgi:hypothetical protein
MPAKNTMTRTFSVLCILSILLTAVPLPSMHAAGIREATPGGTGDCYRWAKACRLQPARAGAASGTNQVSVEDIQSPPGTSGSLGFNLTNQDPVASGEVWLSYDSRNGLDITGAGPTTRTSGYDTAFLKDATDPAQVKVHLLFYNLSGTSIAAGSGSILGLNFNLAASASGKTMVHLETVLLSDSSGSPLPVDALQDGSVTVTTPPGIRVFLPLIFK